MNANVFDRIEESRRRWNVLEHPFYQRWSEGELTREELSRYSGQYRHAVEAIATLSASAADALPERKELRRHAAEELGHVRLWDGFVEAVGGDAAAEPTSETADLRLRLDRRGRRDRTAFASLRGRGFAARDLPHEARGAPRALRLRGRLGHGVLQGPRGPRRRAGAGAGLLHRDVQRAGPDSVPPAALWRCGSAGELRHDVPVERPDQSQILLALAASYLERWKPAPEPFTAVTTTAGGQHMRRHRTTARASGVCRGRKQLPADVGCAGSPWAAISRPKTTCAARRPSRSSATTSGRGASARTRAPSAEPSI